jgi:hypothetical protein
MNTSNTAYRKIIGTLPWTLGTAAHVHCTKRSAVHVSRRAAISSSFPWTVRRPPVPAVLAQAGQAGFEFFLLSNRIHTRPHASTLQNACPD